MLWHLPDRYQNGMIEQRTLQAWISFLVGTTADEARELFESHRLVHMMHASNCLRENGMANVKQFVQHYYKHQHGETPLEGKEWDQLLIRRLKEVMQLAREVAPCAQGGWKLGCHS